MNLAKLSKALRDIWPDKDNFFLHTCITSAFNLLLFRRKIMASSFCFFPHSREFSFVFAVVPQPVYMNMNDLKALAAQKAAVQQHQQFSDFPAEDSPELKTPTAEYTMVPEQKVGLFYLINLVLSEKTNSIFFSGWRRWRIQHQ